MAQPIAPWTAAHLREGKIRARGVAWRRGVSGTTDAPASRAPTNILFVCRKWCGVCDGRIRRPTHWRLEGLTSIRPCARCLPGRHRAHRGGTAWADSAPPFWWASAPTEAAWIWARAEGHPGRAGCPRRGLHRPAGRPPGPLSSSGLGAPSRPGDSPCSSREASKSAVRCGGLPLPALRGCAPEGRRRRRARKQRGSCFPTRAGVRPGSCRR